MRNVIKFIPLILILLVCVIPEGSSQGLLKKAAKKLQKDAEKMLLDEKESDSNQGNNPTIEGVDSPDYSEGSTNREKRKMTPPDVNKNIAAAETSLKAENYDKTRFALRQALIGVELELGYSVLKSLPKELNGNKSDENEDHITSTGVGFAGLHIERDYRGDDQSVNLSIVNNAAMMGMYSGVISTPGYTDENQKSVMVGDYQGVLEAHAGGFYHLELPFGQTSALIMRFENFKNENEVLKSAEKIDMNNIKELLGEQ